MTHNPPSRVVLEDVSGAGAQIDALCALFEQVYGHPVDARTWRWKYHAGPRLGHLNIVARDAYQGRVVGHIGATIFPGLHRGEPLPMAQVCDVMVEPGARGGLGPGSVYGRLVGAMRQALASRFPNVYAYGFPGGRPFALGERVGYYRRLAILRSVEMTAGKALGWRDWFVAVRRLEWGRDHVPAAIDGVWRRVERDSVAFAARASGSGVAGRQPAVVLGGPLVRRDAPYVAWRYRDHPSRSYALWEVHTFGRCAGWMVTAALEPGRHAVVDALVPAVDAMTALRALWRALAALEHASQVRLYRWWPLADLPSRDEPIVPTEFVVGHAHAGWPPPYLQPGDTDVY
jgi:hypothetical protein